MKEFLFNKGLALLQDPRVMRLMQDERVMKAVLEAVKIGGKVQESAAEQTRKVADLLGLKDASELRDLRKLVDAVRRIAGPK